MSEHVGAALLDEPTRTEEAAHADAPMSAVTDQTAAAEQPAVLDRDALFEQCQELATDANPLDRFVERLHACTFVGDIGYAKLLYLTLTTRFFNSPVSVVIKGPAAGGKSFLLKTALRFVPESAYVRLSGMSEKYLGYAEVDLRHKHLVIQEMAGLQNPNGNWMLRTLLSEGRIEYSVTLQPDEGGQREGRIVTQEGPTGLIMTTTETCLHPEDESRIISINVLDTTEQTRLILLEQAREDAGERPENVSFEDWHAFHNWISAGVKDVVVPFSAALRERVVVTTPRVTRDANQMISFIKAHALVHQHQRGLDEAGRIVAQPEDYEAVFALTSELFSQAAGATVPQMVRKTVNVVREMVSERGHSEGLSKKEISERMGVDPSVGGRHVVRACDMGFLIDREPNQGRQSKIHVGEPMREDRSVFPAPDILRAANDNDPGVA